ncbi:MAG: ferrochelatase [Burkholderiaceae bacterium]|nr:ferrochelatase [Burkholderiaceae bacterium]MEB2320165.1 ferrochelatase [Pseudomonadota bacterium]
MSRLERPEQPPALPPSDFPRCGVLLAQLGTPDAPEPSAVRRYLAEFLSDPRVVEIPAVLWQPVLRGVILPFRPARSARKYRQIWTDQGSPLLVNTRLQASLLRGLLGEQGFDVEVAFAMRYGTPSIPSVLRTMRESGVGRLLLLPMYPQYSGTTTATACDAVFAELARWRDQPEVRTIRSFPDDAACIDALAARIEGRWMAEGRPGHLLMSFHGLPERAVRLGDPYRREAELTAGLLARRLGLADGEWSLAFQSRFGRAKWLEPATDASLVALARRGVTEVDVTCPGFVADCLETLEEIAIEGRDSFLAAGGRRLRYLDCPNGDPGFVRALASLVALHLAGWPCRRPDEAAVGAASRSGAPAA